EPRARLGFEAGVVVVLELRPDREADLAAPRGELVLNEAARETARQARREEGESQAIVDVIAGEAVADPPEDLLPFAERESVLEIQIVGGEIIPERPRDVAMGPVDVGLNLEVGPIRDPVSPAPESVGASEIGVARSGRLDSSAVCITLQRENVVRRRLRVQPEPALPHAKAIARVPPARKRGVVPVEVLPVDTVEAARSDRILV